MDWRKAEERACEYLRREGFLIVARNWRWPRGEVDIIAKEGKTLVFVEVKARTGLAHGHPAAAVGPEKRRRLIRSARAFLGERAGEVPVRFDVISILGGEITHIRGAFGENDVR